LENRDYITFTTGEAAKLSHLSISMVDYICREGIVIPQIPKTPGRGRRRKFNFGEVVLLRTISKILNKGISIKRIKSAIKTHNKIFREMSHVHAPSLYFITDGHDVYIKTKENRLCDLTSNGQQAFAFMLDLEVMHSEVREDILKRNLIRARPVSSRLAS